MSASTREAHLFNIQEVASGAHSLYVEFYAGDILAIFSDALIVSTWPGEYSPMRESVLGSLAEAFKLDFSHGLPTETKTLDQRLHRVPARLTPAFRWLWFLDSRRPGDYRSLTQANIAETIQLLTRNIVTIVTADVTSVSLPLLGTGYSGLKKEDVVRALLREIQRWPALAPGLRIVRVFAYDFESIALLNQAIEQHFGRESIGTTALLDAATKELNALVQRLPVGPIQDSTAALFQVSTAANPSAVSIALAGRKVAEVCAKSLHRRLLGEEAANSLQQNLNKMQETLQKQAPWILSYLRLLQVCGNHAAHAVGARIGITDAAAVLVAAIRAAEFAEGGPAS